MLLYACSALAGCALVGFDPLPEPQEPQAPDGPELETTPDPAGMGGAGSVGTGGMNGSILSMPGALELDGAVTSRDASNDDDPVLDAGVIESDASACEANACGGCGVLAETLGSSCGACGVGRYVCASKDATTCEGGEALPVAAGLEGLIDDFEDGDRYVSSTEGRSGAWYTTDDGTGGVLIPAPTIPFSPSASGFAGSAHAARMVGSGFTDWGASLSVSLSAYQCAYDAAAYQGLSVRVRGTGTASFSVATRNTVPFQDGGLCLANCYDHFSLAIPLTGTWQQRFIPFAALAQSGWGTPTSFDSSALIYIELAFGPNTSFDLTLDDLRFY